MTEFSLFATSRLSLALCIPNVYVSKPRDIFPSGRALEWIEMKRSALFRLAMAALSLNSMKTSVLRVYITFTSGQFRSTYLPKASATLRFTSFSSALTPRVPGSLPPCPASMTSVKLGAATTIAAHRHQPHTIIHILFIIN